MSAQTIREAYAPIEAEYHAQIQRETFGHLAPKKNKTYSGVLIFAVGCFGNDHLNPTALECEFEGLSSSPWFFDSVDDFMRNHKGEVGCVYRFEGNFRNYVFRGQIKRMNLV